MPSPTTAELFAATAAAPRIRVGIGGWTFAPWCADFHPAGPPQRREPEYASRRLTAIEIDGTWYGAQKPATYAKWRSETPDGFVFSLKAPRYAVEGKVLANAGKTIDAFVFGGLAELGDRLVPILWQFPPSRRFERDDFAAFLDLLPRAPDGRPLRHALEVRHSSFLCEAYLDLARAHRLPSVFTDSDEYPSFADSTGDCVYARLMRSRAEEPAGYAPDALDAWAARARQWAAGGAPADLPYVQPAPATQAPRDVFVYFISSAKARNPAAAQALQARLAG